MFNLKNDCGCDQFQFQCILCLGLSVFTHFLNISFMFSRQPTVYLINQKTIRRSDMIETDFLIIRQMVLKWF